MKVAEASTHTASAQVQKKDNQAFFNKPVQQGFFPAAAATTHHFFNSPVQARLNIGQPGDKYEKEADEMANKVVQSMGALSNVQAKPIAPVAQVINHIQTKCDHCEEEEKLQKREEDNALDNSIQTKPIFESGQEPPPDEEGKPHGQCTACGGEKEPERKVDTASSTTVTANVENSLNGTKGSGASLPAETKVQMEAAFGADFSGVHIHNDSTSATMSRELNAQAFTHGSDIYFNSGRYDTGSSQGKNLLAHELTHVLQQGGSHQPVPATTGAGARVAARKDSNAVANTQKNGQAQPQAGKQQKRYVVAMSRMIPVFNTSMVPQLQLRANPALAPKGLTCVTMDAPGTPGTTDVFFTSNGSLLDATATTSIENFSGGWVRGGLSDDIIVSGYASKEGREPDNWRLSCNRAESVHTELARIGVPDTKITTFAHGPTEDFDAVNLEPNRRATITTTPGTGPVITPVITPADNFAGRSTTRFGISETLGIDYTALPGIAAAEHFGVHWTIVTGAGTMISLPSVRIPGTPFVPLPATYLAGNTAATEQLALTVIGGPAAGFNLVTANLPLIAPLLSYMVQIPGSGLCHVSGRASVGFRGDIFMLPSDVSFNGIRFMEGTGLYAGTGSLSGPNGALHTPTPTPVPIGGGNVATGSQVLSFDTADIGPSATPSTGFLGLGTPDWTGSFVWPIQWQYVAPGLGPITYMTAFQIGIVDSAGNAQVSKSGAGPFSRALADPTSCVSAIPVGPTHLGAAGPHCGC